MAKPLWQQKIQDKLTASPMCFVVGGTPNSTVVKHVSCLSSSEKKGKKVTLRLLVNYSFNTCAACKQTIR